MPLTQHAAFRKDQASAQSATFQHRHYSKIAQIISRLCDADQLSQNERRYVAYAFSDQLACTNPRFDRARFLRACNCE